MLQVLSAWMGQPWAALTTPDVPRWSEDPKLVLYAAPEPPVKRAAVSPLGFRVDTHPGNPCLTRRILGWSQSTGRDVAPDRPHRDLELLGGVELAHPFRVRHPDDPPPQRRGIALVLPLRRPTVQALPISIEPPHATSVPGSDPHRASKRFLLGAFGGRCQRSVSFGRTQLRLLAKTCRPVGGSGYRTKGNSIGLRCVVAQELRRGSREEQHQIRCRSDSPVGDLRFHPSRTCERCHVFAVKLRGWDSGWDDANPATRQVTAKSGRDLRLCERMTGFEPATSTLARHRYLPRSCETVRSRDAPSGQ